MMKICTAVTTCICIVFVWSFAHASAGAIERIPKSRIPGKQAYILLLHEPPLVSYEGGIEGYGATSPKAGTESKLRMDSPEVQAYQQYLLDRQDDVLAELQTQTRRAVAPKLRYTVSLNGFAIDLTPAEAAKAAKLPGVAKVLKDEMRYPQTDTKPKGTGAPTI